MIATEDDILLHIQLKRLKSGQFFWCNNFLRPSVCPSMRKKLHIPLTPDAPSRAWLPHSPDTTSPTQRLLLLDLSLAVSPPGEGAGQGRGAAPPSEGAGQGHEAAHRRPPGRRAPHALSRDARCLGFRRPLAMSSLDPSPATSTNRYAHPFPALPSVRSRGPKP